MQAIAAATKTVVIAGNPNTGKSTLFNRLTGGRARVGNYPGITVERHIGVLALPDLSRATVADVPGTYSLSSRSADEQIALQTIAGIPPATRPDAVLLVVDATQLARNLYLVLQVLELGVPAVVALNMTDDARRLGLDVDGEALARELGVPVVAVVARKGEGIEELKRAIAAVLHDPTRGRSDAPWRQDEAALAADLAAVAAEIPARWANDPAATRALATWALLSLDDDDELREVPPRLRAIVRDRRANAERQGRNLDDEIVASRYAWIDAKVPGIVRDRQGLKRFTDRIDRVLLHPLLGFVLFIGLMTLLFQALFAGADPFIGWIEAGFAWLGDRAVQALPPGMFADFIVGGVIAGVGAFVVFLPQIVFLFLFLGLMEDSGYMARVAVLMDRIMRAVGLHGRAFVPLLSGYACAVPAILATRNMERHRDRLLTMMVLPLMTCSARLPVYGLLIAALAPRESGVPFLRGMLLAGMYVFGTVMALACAWVLGRTVLKGPKMPLLIEMPPYRLPHLPSVFRTIREQSVEFLKKAGTIILICSIAMWFLLAFPRLDAQSSPAADSARAAVERRVEAGDAGAATELARIEHEAEAEQARQSYAGRIGRALEPVIEPLGFDWRIGIGILGAFAAREVFVSTMGVVYGVGSEGHEDDSTALRERLSQSRWPDGRPVFTGLACLSLMVFFALACQCFSTLAVTWRETRTWRWPVFMVVYMTVLAWLASFGVYQIGSALGA